MATHPHGPLQSETKASPVFTPGIHGVAHGSDPRVGVGLEAGGGQPRLNLPPLSRASVDKAQPFSWPEHPLGNRVGAGAVCCWGLGVPLPGGSALQPSQGPAQGQWHPKGPPPLHVRLFGVGKR